MKLRFWQAGICGVGLIVWGLISCESIKETRTKESEKWPQHMQNISQTVVDLLPYVYNRKKFHNPENETPIKNKIAQFSKSVHKVPTKMGEKLLGQDPIIRYSLKSLRNDVDDSVKVYDAGHLEYARTLLKSSLNELVSTKIASLFHVRTGL